MVVPVGADTWLADGRTPIDEFEEALDVVVDDGPYTTLAGLFLFLSGSIPTVGDVAQLDHLELSVRVMDRRRIDKLLVRRIESLGIEPAQQQ